MATTKHTCGGPKFGKLAPTNQCPRCDELRAGAAPVRWTISRTNRIEEMRVAAIRAHDCKTAGCGVVCTFGDW